MLSISLLDAVLRNISKMYLELNTNNWTLSYVIGKHYITIRMIHGIPISLLKEREYETILV